MSNNQLDLGRRLDPDHLRNFMERGRKTQMAVDAEIARVLESKNQIQRQLATDDADDVRADIDRLKDRYRSLSLAVLKRLRASSTRHPTRSDIALDELIAEREPEVLREERTKPVTQIANKPEAPTDEDLAFWDVMDEEYESNIRQFESPKVSPDQGRPDAPDDGFWLEQILSAPPDPKQPYFDPIPADQLSSEYATVLAKSNASVGRGAELLLAFRALTGVAQQQAVRLSRDYVDGKISPGQRARMQQVEFLNKALNYANVGLGERGELEQVFFALSDETRDLLVNSSPKSDHQRATRELLDALRGIVRTKRGIDPTPPVYAPNLPKGPDLQGLMQEALRKDQKRARFSKL